MQHHKVFRIFFSNLCVLCVSVVKTADFEIEYRFSGLNPNHLEKSGNNHLISTPHLIPENGFPHFPPSGICITSARVALIQLIASSNAP